VLRMKSTHAATLVALAALMAFAAPARADNPLLAAGPLHTCALAANGSVRCWGDNGNGELGTGSGAPRAVPVQVVGLGSGMKAVAAKGDFSCALTAAGAVKCWGADNWGTIGDGRIIRQLTPSQAVRNDALYVFVHVRDDFQSYAVTPRECVAHWLADSVEILIDPRGNSSETNMETAATFVFISRAGTALSCCLRDRFAYRR